MRKPMITCSFAALLLLPVAGFAQDEHAAHHPKGNEAAADAMNTDGAMMDMDGQIEKMQELMARIRTTADPKERQRLMQEHMQAMHDGMKSMRGMGKMMGKHKDSAIREDGRTQHDDAAAPRKSGADKNGGMMDGKMMMGGMMKRHKMMMQRMERMESMMEQMLEHEAMEREIESR